MLQLYHPNFAFLLLFESIIRIKIRVRIIIIKIISAQILLIVYFSLILRLFE